MSDDICIHLIIWFIWHTTGMMHLKIAEACAAYFKSVFTNHCMHDLYTDFQSYDSLPKASVSDSDFPSAMWCLHPSKSELITTNFPYPMEASCSCSCFQGRKGCRGEFSTPFLKYLKLSYLSMFHTIWSPNLNHISMDSSNLNLHLQILLLIWTSLFPWFIPGIMLMPFFFF